MQSSKCKVQSKFKVPRMLTCLALSLVVGVMAHAQAPAATPTVDQIFDRYVQAIGGKAAFAKLTTRVMVGTWENQARGLTRPLEIYVKAPDKYVQIIGFGEASSGFNGEVGWSLNTTQNGLRELTGAGLARQKREAEFYKEIKIRELYARLTLAGKKKVGDREAYVIEAVSAAGNTEKLYFDAQTGLLVRRDGTAEVSSDGESQVRVASEVYFEDYREVDGIKLPFTIRLKLGSAGIISTRFREIKHNVPIDDSQFSVPNP